MALEQSAESNGFNAGAFPQKQLPNVRNFQNSRKLANPSPTNQLVNRSNTFVHML
jgi:hypothetical protein